jgi:abequosyltransferase
MTPNPLLAIAIPTYNRSEILLENLRAMLPELREHCVAVYISDDSSDDHTRDITDELRTEFPLLVYQKNDPSFGHDKNFFATIAMPDTDYVWYLGDSQYFASGTLEKLLGDLGETRPDMCFLNATKPNGSTRLIEGEAVHSFLLNRTWSLTLTGATIYGRASRALQISDTKKANWKNFPQLGLILEACVQAPRRLLWVDSPVLKLNRKKSSYWLKSAFSVFVKDWSALIRSFPTLFNPIEQDRVIRSHGVNTRLFGPMSLVYLRSLGVLTTEELDLHRQDFVIASPISPIWARLVAQVPQRTMAAVWSFTIVALNVVRRKV